MCFIEKHALITAPFAVLADFDEVINNWWQCKIILICRYATEFCRWRDNPLLTVSLLPIVKLALPPFVHLNNPDYKCVYSLGSLWTIYIISAWYPVYKLKSLTRASFSICITLMILPFYENYLWIRCLILNLASQGKIAYCQSYFWKSLSSPLKHLFRNFIPEFKYYNLLDLPV